ncbi:MAG: membrane protein insertion efficiency factor YidD [Alphaproteobacteria bacterium]|nr:membrane protein insertion efficiency factor YidD [Alphaproteobacteria bacterium]MBN2779843.1 membrane protein insertion efficiency factor YidD [Alphaproteobacteria bacterium]
MFKTVLLKFIRLYQILLSPVFGRNCRFTPSCSDYTTQAIEKHGVLKGSKLAAKRLCKCHPWGKSGYDPVPDKED